MACYPVAQAIAVFRLTKSGKATQGGDFYDVGVPSGLRTRVRNVRGCCPRPLDDGDAINRQDHLTPLVNEWCVNSLPKGKGCANFCSGSKRKRVSRERPRNPSITSVERVDYSTRAIRASTSSLPIKQSVLSICGVRSAAHTQTRNGFARTFIEIPCSSITAWMQP